MFWVECLTVQELVGFILQKKVTGFRRLRMCPSQKAPPACLPLCGWVCMRTQACMQAYTRAVCLHVCICEHFCAHMLHAHAHTYMHTHICVVSYVYACVHVYAYVHIHMYSYAKHVYRICTRHCWFPSLFFFLWLHLAVCGTLVSWTGIDPVFPSVEVRSLDRRGSPCRFLKWKQRAVGQILLLLLFLFLRQIISGAHSHAELQTASWLGKVNVNALSSSFICQALVILWEFILQPK